MIADELVAEGWGPVVRVSWQRWQVRGDEGGRMEGTAELNRRRAGYDSAGMIEMNGEIRG
jgi:hypothetical protein